MKALFFIPAFFTAILNAEIKETSLTIYNNNLAVVNQIYSDECKKGDFEITINNMPQTIISDSINLSPDEYLRLKMISYKNENTDYIKQNVSILTKDNTIITGVLYKFDGENYIIRNEKDEYLLISKGYINYINYGKFDEIDFRNRMLNNGILKLELNSNKSGSCKIAINYLLNNILWSASYDAFINEDESNLSLNGRVVITNNSGYNFKNSRIKLIAGSINRTYSGEGMFFTKAIAMEKSTLSQPSDNEEGIKPSAFSDYYSYDLPLKEISINNAQSLSFDIFSRKGIKFKKIYLYKPQIDLWYFYDNMKNYRYDKNLTSKLIFKNNKENSLDIPLPEGKIRVYKKAGDFLSLIGEDNLKHTPVDSEIEINLGKAFDISGERKILRHEKIRQNVYRDTIQIKIKNKKNERIEVKVKEYLWGNWKIINSTHKYETLDANNIEFNLNAGARTDTTIEYSVEYDFNQ